MILDPATMRPRDAYQLMISSVVPRPIAWVSSMAEDGTLNLAPFSFFMGLTGDPPMLAFSVNRRRGSKKDTLSNIEALGEFVINLVTEEIGTQMNETSTEFGPDRDEFDHAGLTPVPSQMVKPPRVAESPVNMECKLDKVIFVGREGAETGLIIGQVVLWHVRDDLVLPNQAIDIHKLHAIGRMSAHFYSTTNEIFEMVRPPLPQ